MCISTNMHLIWSSVACIVNYAFHIDSYICNKFVGSSVHVKGIRLVW